MPARNTPGAASSSSAGAGRSIAQTLDSLYHLAESDATARQALEGVDRVAGRAESARDRANVAIVRAQAYGTLGQDAKSCEVLKSAAPTADASTAKMINTMLASCP